MLFAIAMTTAGSVSRQIFDEILSLLIFTSIFFKANNKLTLETTKSFKICNKKK